MFRSRWLKLSGRFDVMQTMCAIVPIQLYASSNSCSEFSYSSVFWYWWATTKSATSYLYLKAYQRFASPHGTFSGNCIIWVGSTFISTYLFIRVRTAMYLCIVSHNFPMAIVAPNYIKSTQFLSWVNCKSS